jgi:hypothetical protein
MSSSWIHVDAYCATNAANKALVRTFLCEHLPKCHCPSPAPTRLQNVRPALNQLLRLLRDRGDLKSIVPATPMEAVLEQYCRYLRDMGGLAKSTCTSRVRYAREFLEGKFGRGVLRWQALQPRDGVAFVEQYARRCRPGTAQAAASSLRSFLSYLQFQGWCGLSLAAAVPRIPHWRLSSLPKTMNDEQLRKFLSTFNRSTARGRRDYAMALCQIILGLRVPVINRGPQNGKLSMFGLYRGLYRFFSLDVFACRRMAISGVVSILSTKNKTPCRARGLATHGVDCQSGGQGSRTLNRLPGT